MEVIKLNLVPSDLTKPICHASQFDDGREIMLMLMDGQKPYVLSDEEIELDVKKLDGNIVTTDLTVEAGKNYVIMVTTEQMCAIAGRNNCELKVQKDGKTIYSKNFYLAVEESATAGGIQSASEINNLETQIEGMVEDAVENQYDSENVIFDSEPTEGHGTGYTVTSAGIKAAIDAAGGGGVSPDVITDEYDATSTYAIGDMVIHENALYVCSTAITTAEAWNSAHWTLTDIATAIGTVKTAIPTKTSDLQNDSGFAQIDDTQVSASKTYSSEKIESELQNKYEQKLTQTLTVGENILTEASVALGSNWSGSLESGFTHTSGSTEPLTFNVATTNGKAYFVSFNLTNNTESKVFVKIGNTIDVDVYNGTNQANVGIVADGGYLSIIPVSSYNGTITNLKLREVKDTGDEITLDTESVKTKESNDGITGFWNVAIGFNNFEKNENGSRNVSIGYASLHDFKGGTRNVGIGTFALNRLVSGNGNVAIGADALWYTTKAESCIAIGKASMDGAGNGAEHNIGIGQASCGGVVNGSDNIAVGHRALGQCQAGNAVGNVCIGMESGHYASHGNTDIGYRAGYYLRGNRNVCLGYWACRDLYTSGDDNVFVGYNSGINNTGATAQNLKSVSGSIAIGKGAKVDKSNQMMLGSSDITEVVMCGNKKIIFNNDGTVTWEQLS